jgi:hypothetical protein
MSEPLPVVHPASAPTIRLGHHRQYLAANPFGMAADAVACGDHVEQDDIMMQAQDEQSALS